MNSTHVLVVESDPEVRAALSSLVGSREQCSVEGVSSAEEAERLLSFSRPPVDLILAGDVRGMDGIDWCRALRSREVVIPILLVGEADEDGALVRALDAGADDYVRKPYEDDELLARLRRRLRAHSGGRDTTLRIGRYMFNAGQRLLIDAERNSRIVLADKESKLLWHLHQAQGETISRTALLIAIWGYSRTATTHTVETHIYRLRRKIETSPSRPTIVITERGGYRLAVANQDIPLSLPLAVRSSAIAWPGTG